MAPTRRGANGASSSVATAQQSDTSSPSAHAPVQTRIQRAAALKGAPPAVSSPLRTKDSNTHRQSTIKQPVNKSSAAAVALITGKRAAPAASTSAAADEEVVVDVGEPQATAARATSKRRKVSPTPASTAAAALGTARAASATGRHAAKSAPGRASTRRPMPSGVEAGSALQPADPSLLPSSSKPLDMRLSSPSVAADQASSSARAAARLATAREVLAPARAPTQRQQQQQSDKGNTRPRRRIVAVSSEQGEEKSQRSTEEALLLQSAIAESLQAKSAPPPQEQAEKAGATKDKAELEERDESTTSNKENDPLALNKLTAEAGPSSGAVGGPAVHHSTPQRPYSSTPVAAGLEATTAHRHASGSLPPAIDSPSYATREPRLSRFSATLASHSASHMRAARASHNTTLHQAPLASTAASRRALTQAVVAAALRTPRCTLLPAREAIHPQGQLARIKAKGGSSSPNSNVARLFDSSRGQPDSSLFIVAHHDDDEADFDARQEEQDESSETKLGRAMEEEEDEDDPFGFEEAARLERERNREKRRLAASEMGDEENDEDVAAMPQPSSNDAEAQLHGDEMLLRDADADAEAEVASGVPPADAERSSSPPLPATLLSPTARRASASPALSDVPSPSPRASRRQVQRFLVRLFKCAEILASAVSNRCALLLFSRVSIPHLKPTAVL